MGAWPQGGALNVLATESVEGRAALQHRRVHRHHLHRLQGAGEKGLQGVQGYRAVQGVQGYRAVQGVPRCAPPRGARQSAAALDRG